MHRWEYCSVYLIAQQRDGSGGPARELLEIKRPGADRTSVSHPLGAMGLLNQLGSEGWELVDVESATFYLKRPLKP